MPMGTRAFLWLSGFEICASALGVVDDTAVKCSKLGAHFKNAASSGIALASEFKLSDELCTFFSVVQNYFALL